VRISNAFAALDPAQQDMDVEAAADEDAEGEPSPEQVRSERWAHVQAREADVRRVREAQKALEGMEADQALSSLLERKMHEAELFLQQAREQYRELRPTQQQMELAQRDEVTTTSKLAKTEADLKEVQTQMDKLASKKELLLGQKQVQTEKLAKLRSRIQDLTVQQEDEAKQNQQQQAAATAAKAEAATEVVDLVEFEQAQQAAQQAQAAAQQAQAEAAALRQELDTLRQQVAKSSNEEAKSGLKRAADASPEREGSGGDDPKNLRQA
jgi:chromosome segregation ATPase